MKIHQQKKLLEEALDQYRKLLDEIPEEQFDTTPPDGSWSYAEVYSHILQADFGSLIACEKCARKTAEYTSKRSTLIGALTLFFGTFRPGKIKASADQLARVKKISKEEARNLLVRVRQRLDEVVKLLPDARNNYRIKHGGMGMLNANQWFKFTRIHTQHHLKQLERIKRSLQQG